MRLNQLHLRNFRQHTDTAIDFDSGLTGIIGPNGSGKSTILEAIAWALYGTPAVRGTKEGIRSLRAPARASVRVELDFDLAGHRYHVARTLTSAELYLDGASAPIANTLTGVTGLLRRRMGMTQQEFFNTYFTGQKELSVMAAMGPAERAQFLSRVLGYERLRGAQVLVRERRNVIRGELAGLQSAMPDSAVVAHALAETESRRKDAQDRAQAALRRLQKAHESVSEIEPRWKAAQREREALQEIAAELRLRESEEQGLARDVDRLGRELAEIADARKEIEEITAELSVHADLAAQLHAMESLFRDEGRRKALQQGRQVLDEELSRLRERAARAEVTPNLQKEADAERTRLRRELEETETLLESARTEWVRDQQEAATKREALRASYVEIKQQRDRLADLGPESPCPICTRPLADHFREVLDDLDGKLTAIEVDGRYYAKRMEQLAEMPGPLGELDHRARTLSARVDQQQKLCTDIQLRVQERQQIDRDIAEKETRLAAIAEEIEAIPTGYHVTRHAELRQRHEQFAPMANRAARLSGLTEREPEARAELARGEAERDGVRGRLNELRRKQAATPFSEKAFAGVRAAYEATAVELRAAELSALGAEKELDAARAARAAADKTRLELERTQARLRELTTDRRLHDELDRAFTDMRAELNQHLRPEISELASGFLSDLTDGRYSELELDDEYNIIVLEDGIPKPVISGGEEDLANLVLRLAISQMIAERAGQSFSLLVLDEIFGSLDEARRHNVIELLRRLHDRFEQVVLITHIESVREGLDRVIAVRYDDETGRSRAEQEAPATIESDESTRDDYMVVGAGAGAAGPTSAADAADAARSAGSAG